MGKTDFQARLDRIERQHAARTQPKRRGLVQRMLFNLAWPLSVPLAFVLGVALALGARYARYHMAGLPPTVTPEVLFNHLMTDIGIALAVSFVIRMATSSTSTVHMTVQWMGMITGALCLHLAVHRWPAPFEAMFSPEWVYYITKHSEPDQILFLTIAAS